MKSMKGKILKKLKSIKPIEQYLKHDRVLQIINGSNDHRFIEKDSVKIIDLNGIAVLQEPEPKTVDVTDLMMSLEDDLMDLDKLINQDDDDDDEKENIGPPAPPPPQSFKRKDSSGFSASEASKSLKSSPEHKALKKSQENMSFRRPMLSTGCSLFDPNLLEAFQQTVKQHTTRVDNEIKFAESDHPPLKIQRTADENTDDPLSCFEAKCPPGGSETVIFYTTSLRGIRKTFEDCQSIRFLLESFRIYYIERDVSMHTQFKEELWRVLDSKSVVVPPRLFIKGRYIGGANEVLALHEQGKFRPLFYGVRVDKANGTNCDGCAGFRFVVCLHCHGSHKVVVDDGRQAVVKNCNRVPAALVKKSCPDCNENGLILCPICC